MFRTAAQFLIWSKVSEFVKISKKNWMSITLKTNAKFNSIKIFQLKSNDKRLVNETFDSLHNQEKMKWNTRFTQYNSLVFVIWRTLSSKKRKRRMIMNIRDLNKRIISNIYLMSLQTNIIAAMIETKFISTFDATIFFYQFKVCKQNRHKFTMISHRDQKFFNVTFMKFCESFAYAQRKIDIILKNHETYAKIYINDIVVFSNTLNEHLMHLRQIFTLFAEHEIKLNSIKIFLKYFSMTLLNQKINDLDFITTIEKIAAIMKWKFSHNLKMLKSYFEFTNWFRDYISYYAQKIKSLQKRKIILLRFSSTFKNRFKKNFFMKTLLQSFQKELRAFQIIQTKFRKFTFLIHFDATRQLFIDVDVVKKRSFEAMIYHIKKKNKAKFIVIDSIFFLSKCLSSIETRYWSIELKIAKLIWMTRKTHHMIKKFRSRTIVWTNHNAIINITQQTKLSSFNVDKLNLRLIRASTYLSQFDIDVKHKFERKHVISNALSRLLAKSNSSKNVFEVENVNVYHDILIQITSKFKRRLITTYKIDKEWIVIWKMFTKFDLRFVTMKKTKCAKKKKIAKDSNKLIHWGVEFENRNELIYHVNKTIDKTRFCVFKSLIRDIFRMTHDETFHMKFHKCFAIVFEKIFIRKLTHHLKNYISFCSQCRLNQIQKHRSYENMMSILTKNMSFHIIAMNFILTFSRSRNFDFLLNVIDKFFKAKILISKEKIMTIKNWIAILFRHLRLCNWELLKATIFDKNFKFRFEFWKVLFKKLKIQLLINTTYHSQIDELSKRINQITKIVLRYFIIENFEALWHETISALQARFMNASTFTKYLFNQILYDFNVRYDVFIFDNSRKEQNQLKTREIIKKNIASAIFFANIRFKLRYDAKHKDITFEAKSKVYFRLHLDYNLSNMTNQKFSHQQMRLFRITRKIEKLIYELKFSSTIKIHSIISITQLESWKKNDFYNRLKSNNSDLVHMNENIVEKKSYEVKRITQKRFRKHEIAKPTMKYRVKWKKWRLEWNEWIAKKNCNAEKLIKEFEKKKIKDIKKRRNERIKLDSQWRTLIIFQLNYHVYIVDYLFFEFFTQVSKWISFFVKTLFKSFLLLFHFNFISFRFHLISVHFILFHFSSTSSFISIHFTLFHLNSALFHLQIIFIDMQKEINVHFQQYK